MSLKTLEQIQKTVKDLILFDTVWNKRGKIKKLPKEAINRIQIYRNLVKNSFTDLITNIYPNVYKLLKKDWDKLLSKYIETHPPSSPILNKIAEHFPQFLSKEKKNVKKYPFIYELALYEWQELEIYEKEDYIDKGKAERVELILNPIHVICKFEYPIHKIINEINTKKSALKKITKKSTNILIYRDPKNLTVRFFELSQSSLAYIELLETGFSNELVISLLANAYQIKESQYKDFEKKAIVLIKTLKKSRILI